MMNWSKFILNGFSNEKEMLAAEKELQRFGPDYVPKEDELEVKWYKKEGLRYYTVVCRCGNNQMLYHENGIRCHICGRYHSHENFNKKRLEARKLAKINDAKIPIKAQPFYEQQAMGVHRRRLRTAQGNVISSGNGIARVGASTN